jgi:hypothetical protein
MRVAVFGLTNKSILKIDAWKYTICMTVLSYVEDVFWRHSPNRKPVVFPLQKRNIQFPRTPWSVFNILLNPKAHYCTQRNLPPDTTLSQINSVLSLTPYFFKSVLTLPSQLSRGFSMDSPLEAFG